MTRLVVTVVLGIFLLGCTDPRQTLLPGDISSWKSNPELKAAVEKLSPDDQKTLVAYLMRETLASAFSGKSRTEPLTIGDAIQVQKEWAAEKEKEAIRQKELAARLEEQKLEKLKEMNDALTVTLVKLEHVPSDWKAGQYGEKFEIEIGFENHTDLGIAGVKGIVVFKDIFGDIIKKTRLSNDQGVPALDSNTWRGTLDYNQFMDEDRKLRTTERDKLQFDWMPSVYLFSDGSKLEMPSS